MIKKGFIFDLDGVVVDTAKYHFLSWRKLANSLGIEFDAEMNEQLKGVSRIKSFEKILQWGNLEIDDDSFKELIANKNEDYLEYINRMDQSEILPNVVQVIDFLKSCSQPIALGSASKNARRILDKLNLSQEFDAIVDGNDIQKAKPDPEVFLSAANKIKVSPSSCVVFEDSVAGIQAANKAEMLSIGIGDKAILYEADYVFENFTQISNEFLHEIIIS